MPKNQTSIRTKAHINT